jgi:hypothetical protein
MTAVAGFSFFYYQRDQFKWCNNQVTIGNFGDGYCSPSKEHLGFILFLGGLVILVLFLVLFFVVRRRVNRLEVGRPGILDE